MTLAAAGDPQQPQRGRNSQRIKLSRELMVRLSAALGKSQQQAELPPEPEPEPASRTRLHLGPDSEARAGRKWEQPQGLDEHVEVVGRLDGSRSEAPERLISALWAGGSQAELVASATKEAAAATLLSATKSNCAVCRLVNNCSNESKGASRHNKNSATTDTADSDSDSDNQQQQPESHDARSHLFTGDRHRNSLVHWQPLPLVVGQARAATGSSSSRLQLRPISAGGGATRGDGRALARAARLATWPRRRRKQPSGAAARRQVLAGGSGELLRQLARRKSSQIGGKLGKAVENLQDHCKQPLGLQLTWAAICKRSPQRPTIVRRSLKLAGAGRLARLVRSPASEATGGGDEPANHRKPISGPDKKGKLSSLGREPASAEGGRKLCRVEEETEEHGEEEDDERGSSFNGKPSVINEQHEHHRTLGAAATSRPTDRVSHIVNSSSCYAKQQQKQKHRQKSNQATGKQQQTTSKPEADSTNSSQARRTTTRLRRKRKSPAAKRQPEEIEEPNRGPAGHTTTCDPPKCDSLRANGAGQRRGHKQPKEPGCLLRRLLLPLLLLSLWLLFWHQTPGMVQVSGLQLGAPSGTGSRGDGAGSDDLSRAVLATMSTQSPNVSGDTELANNSATISMGNNLYPNLDTNSSATGEQFHLGSAPMEADFFEKLLQFGRIFIMGAIIVGDICGNSLVILSVCRHSKLRVTTNWFVVSLACADILVALFAMTFNASVIISGRWLFKPWVCDFWNSCDVLASTASILHLCCISIDRYIAIMRPLDYPMKITTRRVVYALCGVWISSALLSYIPIFTGIYTTADHLKWLQENPDQCEFVVNRVYAIVSSSISFWIPCCIMVFTYYRIYREATRQEKFIYKAQSMMPAPVANHHSGASNHHGGGNNYNSKTHNRSKQRRSKSVAVATLPGGGHARHQPAGRQQQQQHHLKPANSGATIATTDLNSSGSIQAIGSGGAAKLQQPPAQGQPGEGQARAASMLQLAGSGDAGCAAAAGAESEPLASKAPTIPPAAPDQAAVGNNSPHQQQQQPRAMVAFDERPEVGGAEEDEEEDPVDDSNSGQSTPTKRSISKMKREHKAAKTLGIIMGVFILCWLPFFSWYTPQHICGHACDGIVPRGAVTILFWIGYFNSTLNPIIYAYFNHEFRDAFKKTLQWLFCCCQDLKCLRVNRPNDNQHYNCTYRSTQEIGLVSNS